VNPEVMTKVTVRRRVRANPRQERYLPTIRAGRYGFVMVHLISGYKRESMLSRATYFASIMLHNVAHVNICRHEFCLGTHVALANIRGYPGIRMKTTRPYHHGNLQEALLDAAISLISEVGPAGFTLREVARRAGVSHNAPYRHFRDKDALLAEVAAQGYKELAKAMTHVADRQADALEGLKQAGLAYVSFALRRPEHFTVMFDAPFPKDSHPIAAKASEDAFSVLLCLVKNCQKNRQLPDRDDLDFALFAWAMVHGVAKLAITQRLPHVSRTKILRFARFVIDESLP
jgi:AcrR family transcriptional regulator